MKRCYRSTTILHTFALLLLLHTLSLLCVVVVPYCSGAISYVELVGDLEPPAPQSVERGETEDREFWELHAPLLRKAWNEWEVAHRDSLPGLECSQIVDRRLQDAAAAAWADPVANEVLVWNRLTKVAPSAYALQLFDPTKIDLLRTHLDAARNAKIPTRRPNGMNRYGMIVHPTDSVDGAVVLQEFQRFYDELINTYVRPIGRMVFADFVGKDDDDESYAFTIRYKGGEDLALSEHTDASVVTLNVNLNLEKDEKYSGSQVCFLNDDTNNHHNVTFEPGVALLHLGQTRHAALPIGEGERTNLVVWLHGRHHYVRVAPYEDDDSDRFTPRQRWSTSVTTSSEHVNGNEPRWDEL